LRGRIAGVCVALSHGLGIGIYALITAFGLSEIIQRNLQLFLLIQIAGCLFLGYMGIKLIFKEKNINPDELALASSSKRMAARDGFLIVALNPKILIFFTALFSQFVTTKSDYIEKLYLAAIAGGVDAVWYILVAILISSVTSSTRLKNLSIWLDKVFGLFFVSIAMLFIVELLSY
jgi:threonine/homoserine/homoserine lactone efflux protein